MEAQLTPSRLAYEIEALSAGAHLAQPDAVVSEAASLFRRPEKISTVECSTRRILPGAEDGATVRYDPWRTPYNIGPQNSLDDPACRLIVMPKPSRSGGTTVAENYVFKMCLFGPMGHVAWVLNSDEAVTDYCRTVVKPMFELNETLQAKVDPGRGNDTDTYKRVSGYPIEWLSAKDSTFRNRQPIFMVSDETDAWGKKYAKTPRVQIRGRQKLLGNRAKGAIMSHPDLGWNSGVAAEYEDSSRGIYIMRCVDCLGFAAAYATKFWPEVPQFKLDWTRSDSAGKDDRLELAERSAGMVCPHCGVSLTDEQRRKMIDDAVREGGNALAGWMHRGQTLDPVEGVMGEMLEHPVHGFWVHGLMLKTEAMGTLARALEEAMIDFERTKDPDKLKETMSKSLGEVFEGAATTGGVSANGLKARVKASTYLRGIAPAEVRFITAAVDTGGRKFDVVWIGWDLEGRSWILDRQTIRQRLHDDGTWRDLHVGSEIEDWTVLFAVADRTFPIQGRPEMALPVAVVCIDSGDGNITWKARAFARRALKAGYSYKIPGGTWSKFKLIKGFPGKKPMLPDAPRKVDKDEDGRPVQPAIFEYNLGADKLKELTFERLAVTDGGPGQVYFAAELEHRYIDEFFGESLIDGKWIRSGPNEMLDLHGYAEAGRQILSPERADIKWHAGILPVWAKPVALQPEGGDLEAPAGEATEAKPKTIFDRHRAMNRRTTPNG